MTPFWNVTDADVRSVMKPSRIQASTSSVRAVDELLGGQLNWYGAW